MAHHGTIAGYRSCCSASRFRGKASAAAGSKICLDLGILSLEWGALYLGSGPLRASTSAGGSVGCAAMGCPQRHMDIRCRLLALRRIHGCEGKADLYLKAAFL